MWHIGLRIWLYPRLRSLFRRWAGRRLVAWLLAKGGRLDRRGVSEAAVVAAREAVDAGARIASSDPERYSGALDFLARALLRRRRLDEAAVPVERMVALADEVAAVDSAVGDRVRGWALMARSSMRQEQGHTDEALADAVEAVRLSRAQALSHRQGRANLAAALRECGFRYTALGRYEDAVAAFREALDLYARLGFWQPMRFGFAFVEARVDLVQALGGAGDYAEAVRQAEICTGVLRFMVRCGLRGYRPMLARLVNNSAAWYHEQGDLDAAVKAAVEAVELYRILAGHDEAAYAPLLSVSHHNLVIRRRAAHRRHSTAPVVGPVTLPGRWLRAMMLREAEERVRLHAEVERTGSFDELDQFIQIAFRIAVRHYFGSRLDRLIVAEFVANVEQAVGPEAPAAAMDILICRALGEEVSVSDIDDKAEVRGYLITLAGIADLLERDRDEIDTILTHAEAAAHQTEGGIPIANGGAR
ncbi:tetratricopeptide repeat protein [Actinomycetes bacterium KLBMP 9797]